MKENDDLIIEQFLLGKLSDEEAAAFRERMESDADLRERVKLEEELFQVLNEEDWSHSENTDHPEVQAYTVAFASNEVRDLKQTIETVGKAYHSPKENGRSRWMWLYAAAAAVVLVAAIVLLRPDNLSTQELYLSYLDKTELPDLASRTTDEQSAEVLRAQALFNNEEYETAAALFEKLLTTDGNNAGIFINLALSQAQLGQFDRAIAVLDRLIGSQLLDAQKGYWYKALVYLAADRPTEAKNILDEILANGYYNRDLAEQLQNQMD